MKTVRLRRKNDVRQIRLGAWHSTSGLRGVSSLLREGDPVVYVQPTLFDGETPRITRGLVVRQPWADMILAGQKVWEVRGASTHVRGPIAIIAGGTGRVIGVVSLIAIQGPLTADEYRKAYGERGAPTYEPQPLPYPKTFAWILSAPRRLSQPVAYEHPAGTVIWVKLPKVIQEALTRYLSDGPAT